MSFNSQFFVNKHGDLYPFFNVSSAFQPKNFDFPKKGYGKQNRSFQQKWFEQFPWLHYNEENDSVLCFICTKQNAKENLISATKKEEAFLKGGFSNWKKALDKFKEHEASQCHKTTVDYEVNIPMSNENCRVFAIPLPARTRNTGRNKR